MRGGRRARERVRHLPYGMLRNPAALAWALLAGACSETPRARAPIQVAAASDLSAAFEALGRRYQASTGVEVRFTFGSTGLLAQQIAHGAPFDLFAAANVSFVRQVVASGACDPDSEALYARGRLVMWTRPGLAVPSALAELAAPRFARVAIANPEHAPYGEAAKQALEKAGLWSSLAPRVVYGENVSQALQFARSGNADVALVALSLARAHAGGAYREIPESLHAPIDQALVSCRHGARREEGRAFGAFVNSQEGRRVMRRYGFALPGETLVQSP